MKKNTARIDPVTALALLILIFFFSPKYFNLLSVWLSSTAIYSDDVFSQVAYLGKCAAIGNFEGDYIADYAFRALLPFGYKSLLCGAAYLVDPFLLSRFASVLLLLVFFGAHAASAARLGGSKSLVISLAFCMAADTLLLQVAGGLPHSVSIPFLAVFILASITNRPLLLAVLVPLAAAFYPILCPLLGIYLVIHLAHSSYLQGRILNRDLLMLSVSGFVSLLLVAPMLVVDDFGVRITDSYISEFPEAGAEGRYDAFSRPPFPSLFEEFLISMTYPVFHGGRFSYSFIEQLLSGFEMPSNVWTVAILCLAGIFAVPDSRARTRICLILVSCAGSYYLTLVCYPYLYFPGRAIEHCLSVLTLVLMPVGILAILRIGVFFLARSIRDRCSAAVVLACALLIPLCDGVYLPVNLDRPKDVPLYKYLEKIEENIVIAGWMDGLVNRIPYTTGKSVYLSYETHQALHTSYTAAMRARAIKVINAVTVTDAPSLQALRNDGVDFLLIEQTFLESNAPLEYFQPFDSLLRSAPAYRRPTLGPTTGLPSAALVFESPDYALFDLRQLQQ